MSAEAWAADCDQFEAGEIRAPMTVILGASDTLNYSLGVALALVDLSPVSAIS
jgi:hypothetical protein